MFPSNILKKRKKKIDQFSLAPPIRQKRLAPSVSPGCQAGLITVLWCTHQICLSNLIFPPEERFRIETLTEQTWCRNTGSRLHQLTHWPSATLSSQASQTKLSTDYDMSKTEPPGSSPELVHHPSPPLPSLAPNKPSDHLQDAPPGLHWSHLPTGAPHPSILTPDTQVWQLQPPHRATD